MTIGTLMIKTFVAFPTWVVFIMCKPFLPKEHPFKKKHISLLNWSANATDLCMLLGFLLWVDGIGFVFCVKELIKMFHKL